MSNNSKMNGLAALAALANISALPDTPQTDDRAKGLTKAEHADLAQRVALVVDRFRRLPDRPAPTQAEHPLTPEDRDRQTAAFADMLDIFATNERATRAAERKMGALIGGLSAAEVYDLCETAKAIGFAFTGIHKMLDAELIERVKDEDPDAGQYVVKSAEHIYGKGNVRLSYNPDGSARGIEIRKEVPDLDGLGDALKDVIQSIEAAAASHGEGESPDRLPPIVAKTTLVS